jgi:transcriptional regulator with XRE-family HTH domain
MLNFSERLSLIKNSLRKKGLTQKDVAKNLNSHQRIISETLSGNREVPMAFLLELIREADHPVEKVFPNLKEHLAEIVELLEKGASQEATINLINLMKLTNHYEDTKAAS